MKKTRGAAVVVEKRYLLVGVKADEDLERRNMLFPHAMAGSRVPLIVGERVLWWTYCAVRPPTLTAGSSAVVVGAHRVPETGIARVAELFTLEPLFSSKRISAT